MQFRHFAAAAALLLLLPACAGRHVKKGDELARKGEWERALVEYRAAAEREKSNANLDKVARAEKEVALLYVNRGLSSSQEGKWGDAGEWWSKALALRPTDTRKVSPKTIITQHAAQLEKYGDESAAAGKYEEAFRAYDPLMRVFPARTELMEKSDSAHKRYAERLDAKAGDLSSQGLFGAALIAEMEVLRHDPLHPTAFQRTEEWRKTLNEKNRVAIANVTVEDRGWWGIGDALVPLLEQRLGEYPPYGRTTSPHAVPGQFVVIVEEFSWWDRVERGYETKRDATPAGSGATAAAAATPAPVATPAAGPWKSVEEAPAPAPTATPSGVENPEFTAQKRLVEELERELAALEKVAPKEEKKNAKRLPAKMPLAEDVDAKKKELDAAKAKLATIQERVDPTLVNGTWTLAWKDVTRTMQVKVRFEVREPDMPGPVSIVRTAKVEAKDRTHAGDEAHGIAPDHLELPKLEALTKDLATKLVGGTEVIRDARTRRAETLVERGRAAEAAGHPDEALDLYVAAIFVGGPGVLPSDARNALSARVALNDIVTAK